MADEKNLVTVSVDGKTVSVPKGTNLIDAARVAGVEVPHYCYHPHLSIAGNCRMCQVEVKGRPKLEIGCNTTVQEGMEIATHESSKNVAEAQAATLEFILINHPLDCTVCDQAGHCKLQDYHFEYNARPSRFLEAKVKKVKAQPLGPTVVLDGERCIMCTRCVRFCEEITGTAEIGMLNRGDRSVISVNEDRPLDNPLSGSVVDLCPVGALTHRQWRFNTRIWFTHQNDGICPGCSTGCNVKVAERDGEIVNVKARLNSAVNKEWLCDEGRYGFMRFLPANRARVVKVEGKDSALELGIKALSSINPAELAILLAPDLLLEDMAAIRALLSGKWKGASVAIAYKEREVSKLESILVSPDYAPNFQGAKWLGLVEGGLESRYRELLASVSGGKFKHVLFVGDRSIEPSEVSSELLKSTTTNIYSVLCDTLHPLYARSHVVIPGRSVLEKSGLLINRGNRLQYTSRFVTPVDGSISEWRIFSGIGAVLGQRFTDASDDREATNWLLGSEPTFSGLSIKKIKDGGVSLSQEKQPAFEETRV